MLRVICVFKLKGFVFLIPSTLYCYSQPGPASPRFTFSQSFLDSCASFSALSKTGILGDPVCELLSGLMSLFTCTDYVRLFTMAQAMWVAKKFPARLGALGRQMLPWAQHCAQAPGLWALSA